MHVYQTHVKKIEQEKMSVIEYLATVNSIKRILEEKKIQEFHPLKVKEIFRKNDEHYNEIIAMKNNFFNSRCIDFLSKWSEQLQEFKCFEWISLQSIPNWDDIEQSLIFYQRRTFFHPIFFISFHSYSGIW